MRAAYQSADWRGQSQNSGRLFDRAETELSGLPLEIFTYEEAGLVQTSTITVRRDITLTKRTTAMTSSIQTSRRIILETPRLVAMTSVIAGLATQLGGRAAIIGRGLVRILHP